MMKRMPWYVCFGLLCGGTLAMVVVAATGPNGTPVTITPLVLCLGDPQETRYEIHRFQMVMGSEDIPDDARYVDLIALPDGATVHLFELGEATPFLQLVDESALPAS